MEPGCAMTKSIENHPNTLLARELWSATAEGDADALGRLFAKDIVWRTTGDNPLAGEIHGPEAVLSYLATVGEVADDFCSTLDSIYVNDDGVVIYFHISATRGEKKLEVDYLLLFRLEDGQAVSALMTPVDQQANDAFWV
jgi:ketosteroid isomerase-like protein